jgi:uncharacterized protein (TIGR03437 family)
MRLNTVCGLALLFLTMGYAQQGFTAHYISIGSNGQSKCMAVDNVGKTFVVSVVTKTVSRKAIRATKLDRNGNVIASFDFGSSGTDYLGAAAVDLQGNLLIVGRTDSSDFPFTTTIVPYQGSAAFITRLDANLTKILASTALGGVAYAPGGAFTIAGSIALDSAGNVYVAGITAAQDFPFTAGSPFRAGSYQMSSGAGGFVAELSPDLSGLVFASNFGPNVIAGLAVAGDGSIVVTGSSEGGLAVTPGTYATSCNYCGGPLHWSAGFVAKLSPAGRSLVWATYLPFADGNGGLLTYIAPGAIALDSEGNILISGGTSGDFPITTGAIQSNLGAHAGGMSSGFICKLDSSGQHLLFGTYFGAGKMATSATGGVWGIAPDPAGNIWITGTSLMNYLPNWNSQPGVPLSFVAAISPDGTRLRSLYTALPGAAGQALASGPAGIEALGTGGSVLMPAPASAPNLIGIENSAAVFASGTISAAEIITLYGYNIGPAMPMFAQISNNVVGSVLGGYQLLFNGAPAPLLYASANQINAVVPSSVAGNDTADMQLVTPQGTVDLTTLFIAPAQPAIFHDPFSNIAAALNQDGTINSPNNPAHAGSIVSVWLTGTGIGSVLPPPDGAVVEKCDSCLFPQPPSVAYWYFGVTKPVPGLPYVGIAPGDVFGAAQINFVVPSDIALPVSAPLEIRVSVGPAISAPVDVYIIQ